jgi:hypothetical protein
MTGPPVTEVDAYLPATDFDALLAAMGLQLDPARAAAAAAAGAAAYRPIPAAPPPAARVLLVPNRASAKGALTTALPWFAAMGIIMLVAGLFAALGLFETMAGQMACCGIAFAVLLGGIVLTFVRGSRTPRPALALEIDAYGVRVVDLARSALVAQAPLAHVRVEPSQHTYSGRGTYTMPVLFVMVPGFPTALVIGVPDLRFSWQGKVPRSSPADYVVGSPDWLTLVERFGVRPRLAIGPG